MDVPIGLWDHYKINYYVNYLLKMCPWKSQGFESHGCEKMPSDDFPPGNTLDHH